ADRIERMGEDRWRIFRVGSPGLDGIRSLAESRSELAEEFPGFRPRQFALLVLHPENPDPPTQRESAELVLRCVQSVGFERIVIVYPNNDPGSDGIAGYWDAVEPNHRHVLRRDIPRALFLGLMREAAVLVGNSSSGIIEAASFGTPVLDIGACQAGRERGENVSHANLNERAICKQLRRIWNEGSPIRYPAKNIYGTDGAGAQIASALTRVTIDRFRRKLIRY